MTPGGRALPGVQPQQTRARLGTGYTLTKQDKEHVKEMLQNGAGLGEADWELGPGRLRTDMPGNCQCTATAGWRCGHCAAHAALYVKKGQLNAGGRGGACIRLSCVVSTGGIRAWGHYVTQRTQVGRRCAAREW